MLQSLKEMLTEINTLHDRNYEANKILFPMGMEYHRIHSFHNDCILHRKEFVKLRSCPKCGLSYKVKDGGD